jgi:transposase IS66 family protein
MRLFLSCHPQLSVIALKSCNYTLTFWNRLTRFLDHSILELSTNAAENVVRPVAMGRKNWIHFGSQEAGPRIAAILSIVETCRRLKIPTRIISPLFCQAWRTFRPAVSLI